MTELSNDNTLSRRLFVQTTATSVAGLVIGFHLPGFGRFAGMAMAAGPAASYAPNAFVRIAKDSSVTIIINKSEMGQGVYTSLAQIIAEELDCDWQKISAESAPVAPVYNHTGFGMQMTGGSTAIASSYDQHRMIGATARALLVQAAADTWKVTPASCSTENGFVLHAKTGKKLAYGELAEKANALPAPTKVTLKDPKRFKLIGKALKRLDAPVKVNGKARFGLDVRLPGLHYAVVARSPVFGGKLKSFDATAAKAVEGVVDVYQVPTGVAVVAKNTWAAMKGREALKLTWDEGEGAKLSTPGMLAEFAALGQQPGKVARPGADVEKVLKAAKHVVDAGFDFPYLAHATMEPLNCTVDYDGERCHIYTGTHMQTMDHGTAAKVLGLDPSKVELTTTLLGGSFGRRANPNSDFVMEAVHVAKPFKKPIQIVWTREDDMRGGYYRPMVHHRVKVGFDAKGAVTAWKHAIVSPSIMAGTPFEAFATKDGIDGTSVEGVADSPYQVPNMHVELQSPKYPVPVQWWRSVGHTHTGFVMESMIDEAAVQAKADPVAYRLKLLAKHPRHVAALKLAATKAGWGKAMPKGHAQGVAVHESFGSVVAHVVEVSLVDGMPRVHKVTSGVHCGRVINPGGAKAQVESGIVYGLSAALYGAITLKDGRPEQGNFDTYRVLAQAEMPVIDVHFVPSEDAPSGLGEPGVPPTAPAVANAVAKLTGKRQRSLPFARAPIS